MSQLPLSAHASKGVQFTKVYRLSSESLLYKLVTICLSACNLLLYVCICTKKKNKPNYKLFKHMLICFISDVFSSRLYMYEGHLESS